ncbi:MAG: hypothetical protein WA840_01855 [Caulobacteraceae bacterium]
MTAFDLRSATYHAVVNASDTVGVYRRVSVAAASAVEALGLFQQEFGEHAIIRFWRDGQFPR